MVPTVLVTGGSGYLGQFLVDRLSNVGWNVLFTYHSSQAPPFAATVRGFKVELNMWLLIFVYSF